MSFGGIALWILWGHGLQVWITGLVAALVVPAPAALSVVERIVRQRRQLLEHEVGELDDQALRDAALVDWVLFDRRGVLTTGRPRLVGAHPLSEDLDAEELVHLATLVEYSVRHPIRDAVVEACGGWSRTVASLKRVSVVPGRGLRAIHDGKDLLVGNLCLLRDLGDPALPLDELSERLGTWAAIGETVLFVVRGPRVLGALRLFDALRPDADRAVQGLAKLGIRTAVRSGDASISVEAVRRDLGLGEAFSEMGESEAGSILQQQGARGRHVARVSRPTYARDAARPRVGLQVSWGSAPKPAAESSSNPVRLSHSAHLPGGKLAAVGALFGRARAIVRLRRAWLGIVVGYHALAIPLLLGALLPWTGIAPSPSLAAVIVALLPASTVWLRRSTAE